MVTLEQFACNIAEEVENWVTAFKHAKEEMKFSLLVFFFLSIPFPINRIFNKMRLL
jgi:hypothetical protein